MLAGQSNMVGTSDQVTPWAIGVAWRADQAGLPTRVGYLVNPLIFTTNEASVGHSSAWTTFARSYRERTGRGVGYIATARGNQCLATDVDHQNAGAWDPDTGWLYARTLEVWNAAGRPPLKAFLWLQGECEAGHWHRRKLAEGQTDAWQYANSYAHYYAALSNLADHVAADFGVPLIPAPINLRTCRLDPSCAVLSAPSQKGQGVHDATIDLAADRLDVLPGPIHDDVYSPDSTGHTWDVIELGLRWADAVLAPTE